jgi:hypothetical protein
MGTEHYGVELQQAIKRAGVTPSSIATELGVSNQTVNNWFKRGAPNKYVTRLASMLQVAAVDIAPVVVDDAAFIDCYRLPVKDQYGQIIRRIQVDRGAIPFSVDKADSSFFLVAPDDSMAPEAQKGDNVMVSDVDPQPGEMICIKAPDGRMFLRQWVELIPGKRWALKPFSENYGAVEIEAGQTDFTIVGIVTGIVRFTLTRNI